MEGIVFVSLPSLAPLAPELVLSEAGLDARLRSRTFGIGLDDARYWFLATFLRDCLHSADLRIFADGSELFIDSKRRELYGRDCEIRPRQRGYGYHAAARIRYATGAAQATSGISLAKVFFDFRPYPTEAINGKIFFTDPTSTPYPYPYYDTSTDTLDWRGEVSWRI